MAAHIPNIIPIYPRISSRGYSAQHPTSERHKSTTQDINTQDIEISTHNSRYPATSKHCKASSSAEPGITYFGRFAIGSDRVAELPFRTPTLTTSPTSPIHPFPSTRIHTHTHTHTLSLSLSPTHTLCACHSFRLGPTTNHSPRKWHS